MFHKTISFPQYQQNIYQNNDSINYYQNDFRINSLTQKLIFISQKDNLASNCKLKIFDIEENHLFIADIPCCGLRTGTDDSSEPKVLGR